MRPYGAGAAREAAASILPRTGDVSPTVAIILGSGLGGLVNDLRDRVAIPYGEIPGLPEATIPGHAGELVIGEMDGRIVVAFAGRFHAYEGHPPQLTAFPVRIAHALGAHTLIVSNAAGGVNPEFHADDLMVIRDHLNLTAASPLTGAAEPGETRFPDMSNAYDAALRAQLHSVGERLGVSLRDGVYAMLPGPAYETPAEVRMLRMLGADAVGMSTVPEVIMARTLAMRVAGVSCITNLAAGMQQAPLAHTGVLAAAERVTGQFQTLIRAFVTSL
jgi:purine-nucleoside phosphorylase